MNEITVVDAFAFGAVSMFLFVVAFYGMKAYVDDRIKQAKREIKRELR